jgi:Zn-dependent protease with chaperone function
LITLRSLIYQLYDLLLYFTFSIRKWLLIALVVMSVVLGVFTFHMPLELRWVFAYSYVAVMMLSIYSFANVYASSAVQMVAMIVTHRRHEIWEYKNSEIDQLQARMGLRGVKVFVTNNRFVQSPFTNPFTKKVYLTEIWVKCRPQSEVLSTLGHEFGHLLTWKRFAAEAAGAGAAVTVASIILALHSFPIIGQLIEFAGLVLMLTWVSWRNEYRADIISARFLGPERIISVLEQVKEGVKRDQGSETHPPLKDRIAKLYAYMDGIGGNV